MESLFLMRILKKETKRTLTNLGFKLVQLAKSCIFAKKNVE